jgi:hypothetical protein
VAVIDMSIDDVVLNLARNHTVDLCEHHQEHAVRNKISLSDERYF